MSVNFGISMIMIARKGIYRPVIELVRYRVTSSRIKRKDTRKPKHSNPGIEKRIGLLNIDERNVEDVGEIEDNEYDFMDVNKMHDLHDSEGLEMKHMQQLKIVENKYFKEKKEPSLLTWSEKEQIHYLHESDEEKWTVQKLAQCFPASENTVQKILKSKWRPLNAERVLKHDEAVRKNWELLRSGKLEVDPQLKEHLEQFTDRTMPVSQKSDIAELFSNTNRIPKPKRSEFANIIESYKSVKNKNEPKDTEKKSEILQTTVDRAAVPKGDSYVLQSEESYVQRGRVTLEKYRERVASALERGKNASVGTQLMLKSQKKNEEDDEESVVDMTTHHLNLHKHDKSVTEVKSERLGPPGRIVIPKNKWRRGGTFKVEDCYYDDDGFFLYRVPGMK
ncbi:putative neugrin-like protein DDB_G0288135 [Periplaneta americana]|uniref:putative neugrin-like protein DDB_G0288135 n=1 Tax=Periplaneta americana TaxID=6978 RepID=UPI0037E97AA6